MNPKCEPQLGKRGIYRADGEHKHSVRKLNSNVVGFEFI
ncbi:winged helix-turn-helix domain-containing protein [Nostoc sp.]